MNKLKVKDTLLNGIVTNNPLFITVLGMCPAIAMSTTLEQAFAMGLATAFVLIFSNLFISLLRNFIPNTVRIPSYIIIIATFVIVIELFMARFLPSLYSDMGAFISLIVVNCIVLARAESFASKNKPLDSLLDGISMGLGFTIAMSILGFARELLASGSIAGINFYKDFPKMNDTAAKSFGFIVFAIIIAAINQVVSTSKKNKAKKIKAEVKN